MSMRRLHFALLAAAASSIIGAAAARAGGRGAGAYNAAQAPELSWRSDRGLQFAQATPPWSGGPANMFPPMGYDPSAPGQPPHAQAPENTPAANPGSSAWAPPPPGPFGGFPGGPQPAPAEAQAHPQPQAPAPFPVMTPPALQGQSQAFPGQAPAPEHMAGTAPVPQETGQMPAAPSNYSPYGFQAQWGQQGNAGQQQPQYQPPRAPMNAPQQPPLEAQGPASQMARPAQAAAGQASSSPSNYPPYGFQPQWGPRPGQQPANAAPQQLAYPAQGGQMAGPGQHAQARKCLPLPRTTRHTVISRNGRLLASSPRNRPLKAAGASRQHGSLRSSR